MPEQEENCPTPKKRSKILTVIVWMIVLLLAPTCGAWVIGRKFYWFDLLASEQMLISWIAVVLTLGVLISRRRKAFVVCVVLVCVSFWPVMNGRVWVLPGIDFEYKSDRVIRVVSYNINPKNEHWLENIHELVRLHADVIVLLELSPEMSRSIQRRGALDENIYPYRSFRHWVQSEVSAGAVLSQWPIENLLADHLENKNLHFNRIQHPLGDVVIGLVHPLSPRSKSRWIQGNLVVVSQSMAAEFFSAQQSIPLLLCADLNAGPAQLRAKTLKRTGLRMSKPVLHLSGSFPSNSDVPKILRVQLDDVWSLGNITPIAWSMIELDGSDHQAVVVDFVMDKE